jgi:hypothetical protein
MSTYAENPAQLAALFDNVPPVCGSNGGAGLNTVHGMTPYLVSEDTLDILLMPMRLQQLWGEDDSLQRLHTPLASSVQPTVQLAAAAVGFMCSIMQQRQEDIGGKLRASLSELVKGVRDTMRLANAQCCLCWCARVHSICS